MTEPMLHLEGVETFYGAIQALRGVNLHVNPGEIVTLIGANGAEEVIEINLTEEEKANLQVSVDAVKELLEACKALDGSLA